MASIQESGFPLVFPTAPPALSDDRTDGFQVVGRSLEGMQKEAVVLHRASHAAWRMVSDEGPYLNGTDLAPFPLAFFTAGMAFSFLSSVRRAAAVLGIDLSAVELSVDNYYTMDGSFLKGNAEGGAMPPDLVLKLNTAGDTETLLANAAGECPAVALFAERLENTFSLNHNGSDVDLAYLKSSGKPALEDPLDYFEGVSPGAAAFHPDIISKRESAQVIEGVEGGAGSSLQATQKRTLHVHGESLVRDDGLMETEITLRKPIGSTFRFVSDDGSGQGELAPPPLAFLVAGICFCYMTQLGRYAQIVKQDLESYRIVQENAVEHSEGWFRLGPFDTRAFLEMSEDADAGEKLVTVGERTCFLHASMRGEYPVRITIVGAA